MKAILFVLRDIMSARIALPIIKLALQYLPVATIAEGKAVGICKEAGITLFLEGSHEQNPMSNAHQILFNLDPDVVCIGCSSPINWELTIAKEAHKQNIPVVALCDIWGCLGRLKGFVPELALVIDVDEAMKEVNAGRAESVAIIGDIASTTKIVLTREKDRALRKVCAGKTSVLIVGDHLDNVEEVASAVAQSIRLEPDPSKFVIFGSFVHPKLAGYPNVVPILHKIEQMFDGLNFVKHQELGVNTDELAAFCDYTATAFSTPGRIAIHHGKRFLSVDGPKSRELQIRETGFDVNPLVSDRKSTRLNSSH